MSYRCPVCGKTIHSDVKAYIDHTEAHIIDVIKKEHPDWVSRDGTCRECLEYYRGQIKGDKTT